jgi:HSP20 family protein
MKPMTLVNFRNRPVEKNFNNVLDTFWAGFPSVFRDDFGASNFKQFAPVNVKEVENGYQLEVVAPGLEKEDFKISLDKNLLTISAETKNEAEAKAEKHLRREYQFQSFKRSFTVDENIDTENIDAKYVNGVLVLNLPKKAEVKPATKQISIL